MNKIKKVWNENRVLLVLGIILIICLVIVAVVSLTFFYGNDADRYADDNIIELNDNLFKDIEEELKTNESVNTVTTLVTMKRIDIMIEFVPETKMEDAKLIAETVIELFNDEELAVYDIELQISSLSTNEFVGYTLFGSRNANGSGTVIWGNYNVLEEDDEEAE